MKFILAVLVLINLTLFAWYRGYLEPIWPSGHEPQRLQQQISPEKIRVLAATPSVPPAPAIRPALAAAPTPAPAASEAIATVAAPAALTAPTAASCIEFGNFSQNEAARFEAQAAALALNQRLSRRSVSDASSYMVLIPPLPDKETADRKAGELRRLDVKDFYVVQTEGELRFAISLGIFKSRAGAEAHLAELVRKGVHSARVSGRGASNDKIAFQLRDLDQSGVVNVQRLANSFGKIEQRECATAAR